MTSYLSENLRGWIQPQGEKLEVPDEIWELSKSISKQLKAMGISGTKADRVGRAILRHYIRKVRKGEI